MKHTIKVTYILIAMFLIAQLVGIFVASVYAPETISVINQTSGEIIEKTEYLNLPVIFQPPKEITPTSATTSIMIALFIAVSLMFLLMKLKAETFLRLWFLLVVIIGIGLGLNAFIIKFTNVNSFYLAIAIAAPLGILKIFQRNFILHNLTEILIYPGIASVFIPILNIGSMIVLLILISFYDMYAVWKAGFMQKMAKYQIEKLKIFSGFFVPYLRNKDRIALRKAKASGKKSKKIRVNLAILGGGDVVFPILLSGVVLRSLGLIPALMIPIGATLGLTYLFYKSEKGKFYPAMPFISVGCLIALGISYLIA